MATSLSGPDFLTLSKNFPVIDVRTPSEFAKGHIPDATNIPLFNDHDHAVVGTAYKHQGRQVAILSGLEIVGPNLRALAERLADCAVDNTLLIHCWRGGMRSQSVAWLASLNGYETYTLTGGYKGFRQLILDALSAPVNLVVLGGASGSGKTAILHELEGMGQQVVDLEGLALHRGSAFGSIGLLPQPTQQLFENQLGMQWQRLDPIGAVWIENESRQLGTLRLPEPTKHQMEQAPILVLDMPFELRVERLVIEYGAYSALSLEKSIRQIGKRLGGLYMQQALNALAGGDLRTCCALLLSHYYDKTYNRFLARKDSDQIYHLRLDSLDAAQNAKTIMNSGVSEWLQSATPRL